MTGVLDRAATESPVWATSWPVWSTTARLVVTDVAALAPARALIGAHLDRVDAVCSRFRPDSEVGRLARGDGRPVSVSALLATYVRAALSAARETGGDVDPTVGAALIGLGYDRDFSLLLPAGGSGEPRESESRTGIGAGAASRVAVVIAERVDWTAIELEGRMLRLPPGVLLDLGATAKALAADECAQLVAARLGCGVLVGLGGDIATAGAAPAGGWQVLVEDRPGEPRCRIALPAGAALATSSTVRRRWWRGGSVVHHIVDPRTGAAAEAIWRTVSVAAGSCLQANTAATAAIVRGRDAVAGLRRGGLPAWLVDRDGAVVALGGWPEPADRSESEEDGER